MILLFYCYHQMDDEISFNFLRYYAAMDERGFLLIQFFSIYHREFASIIAERAVVLCFGNSLHEWRVLEYSQSKLL